MFWLFFFFFLRAWKSREEKLQKIGEMLTREEIFQNAEWKNPETVQNIFSAIV